MTESRRPLLSSVNRIDAYDNDELCALELSSNAMHFIPDKHHKIVAMPLVAFSMDGWGQLCVSALLMKRVDEGWGGRRRTHHYSPLIANLFYFMEDRIVREIEEKSESPEIGDIFLTSGNKLYSMP